MAQHPLVLVGKQIVAIQITKKHNCVDRDRRSDGTSKEGVITRTTTITHNTGGEVKDTLRES